MTKLSLDTAYPRSTLLSWLAAQGAAFVLLRRRDKRPCHKGWLDTPVTLEAAGRHVSLGGNVGLVVGAASSGIVCLDADCDFSLIYKLMPLLRGACVLRDNAPQRGKFLLRLTGSTRNRAWRPRGSRRPALELLAHRKLAVVPPSIHPSGAPYTMQGDRIPRLDGRQLDWVWEALTAATLNIPTSPIPRPVGISGVQQGGAWEGEILAAVKRRWPSALAVFQHCGITGRVRRSGRDDLRITGHGGLLVGRPDSAYAWRWYCFSAEVGGDQIDAAGYCLFGARWDRRHRSMLQAALSMLAPE